MSDHRAFQGDRPFHTPAQGDPFRSLLPPSAYTGQAFFERECASLFVKEWVFVGFAHELKTTGDAIPVMVANTPDAADDWIATRIGPGDVAVTADILLADRCLKAGAAVLGPTGRAFTAENIGNAMATRDLLAHLRETGESKGYNAAFTDRDR